MIESRDAIAAPDDGILVTGASGFIGSRVVERLLELGFRNVRCLIRPSSDVTVIESIGRRFPGALLEIVRGNLVSVEDCRAAVNGAVVIFHLAAGRGEKSFADAYLNSVVAARNLVDASAGQLRLRRFVNVSSFTVYDNGRKPQRRPLDESCPLEQHPNLRGDAYSFAKVKQDEMVLERCAAHGIPLVIVRPGYVYGPGNEAIAGRVGIGTFGLFLHLGGPNTLPLTYVDNCADAIVRAGLMRTAEGQVFNVVDDELPSSRRFLRLYKRHVRRFPSIYVPHIAWYAFCFLWEWYSAWSQGQLPPTFNRKTWHAYWRRTTYSNQKAKTLLGWTPLVTTKAGLDRYFRSCREQARLA